MQNVIQKDLNKLLRSRTCFSRGESRLQKLGRVINVSPSGNAIVKIDKPPKLGTEVFDENFNTVGKIFDIIGPTTAPYAVIKTIISEPTKLKDKPVYLLLSKTKREQKRK